MSNGIRLQFKIIGTMIKKSIIRKNMFMASIYGGKVGIRYPFGVK